MAANKAAAAGFGARFGSNWTLISLILISISFKLLLIPAYHSTDFEVHRNWLAITHSLPISKWYFENTSEWTLDYPPFFAYFEYVLSLPAQYIDAGMLKVDNLNYKSPQTINYQRLSVIATELVLIYAIILHIKGIQAEKKSQRHGSDGGSLLDKRVYLLMQFVFSFGLIIVDNIHFQYNGFLFGIMLLSVYFVQNDRWIIGSFLFSTLINFKHIYLYIAPAYFFYIFFYYCLKAAGLVNKLQRLVVIGVAALVPFALSFGPFILKGQLGQLMSRLFPFKRGLSHAYWAPNAWSLYNFADKLLSFGLKKSPSSGPSATSGLVQDIEHIVLPSISPMTTFILSLIFMILPITILLYRDLKVAKAKTNNRILLVLITICAFSSFLFGWHVHEKAILLITIPLSLVSITDAGYAKLYYFLTVVANYSLFPLIFTNTEYPVKSILLVLTSIYNYKSLKHQFGDQFSFNSLETLYLTAILPLEIYNNFLHIAFGIHIKLAYLPLMLTSVYCSLGVFYSWFKFLARISTKSM